MKKNIIIAALASAVVIPLSCTVDAAPELVEPEEVQMTFTAWTEEPDDSADPETKTVVRNRTRVYWSPGDQVSLFCKSGSSGGSKFTSSNSSAAAKVDFSGSLKKLGTPDASSYYWGIYPYDASNAVSSNVATLTVPSTQTAVAGSFALGAFPSIARSQTTGLRFFNVCGGLILKFSDTSIRSVTIKGNNGETLAGKVKVAFDSNNRPYVKSVVSGATSVTLNAPSGGFSTSSEYYVALLPGKLSKGFTLTFTTSSTTGTFTSSRSNTISRSTFGNLGVCDRKVDWPSAPTSVDLGTGVKWATMNVGASSPEDAGIYVAWGEVKAKSSYTEGNYAYYSSSAGKYTKYVLDSSVGNVDGKTILEASDDPATVIMGSGWRTPTSAELENLRTKCKWTWTTQNGVKGYKITGNGNSIFLPAAGRYETSTLKFADSYGFYWASTLYTPNSKQAGCVCFSSEKTDYALRYSKAFGHTVRAVAASLTPATGITASPSTVSLSPGGSATITVKVTPSNATETAYVGVSSDESVATVSGNKITAAGPGQATVTFYASSGKKAEVSVVCQDTPYPETSLGKSFPYVDLGLSVCWGGRNLGATTETGSGDYYAWGETSTKSSYSWSNYKWCNGTLRTMTKYCSNSSYGAGGFTDNKSLLMRDDDVVQVKLGGKWRMPTKQEISEVNEKCTFVITARSGVTGMEITGPNKNKIFIPASGYKDGSTLNHSGEWSNFWSASGPASSGDNQSKATYASGFKNKATGKPSFGYYSIERYIGMTVRPVRTK